MGKSLIFALQNATLRIKKLDGQTVEKQVPFEKAGNAFRITVPVADIMRRMKAEGIDKAEICSVGWNISGHDGRFPQFFPVEPKLGGEAKFREAIAEGKSLGYHINCHINPFSVFSISNRWNDNGIAMYPDGSPFFDYFQPGGKAFRPCFQRYHDLWIKDDFKKMKALGLNGIMHLDVMSFVHPYPCKDPMHPLNRQQTVDYENKVGAYAHEIFGGLRRRADLTTLRRHSTSRSICGRTPTGRASPKSSPRSSCRSGSLSTTA